MSSVADEGCATKGAILDARVLARELALQPTIEGAIETYDRERRPATAAVVRSKTPTFLVSSIDHGDRMFRSLREQLGNRRSLSWRVVKCRLVFRSGSLNSPK